MKNSRDLKDLLPIVAAKCAAFVSACKGKGLYFVNYLWNFLNAGVETAFSMLQWNLSIRHLNVDSLIPIRSAHSAIHKVSPLNSNTLFVLVFRACSFGIAHLQFSLLYPFSLLILSKERFFSGTPISEKNFSNEFFQSSHTFIPRPP